MVGLPEFMKLYPQMLREAGYYTTNNSKTDYNFPERGTVWDESSTTAHWSHRKPGQPFFAIFNIMQSHESAVRRRPHAFVAFNAVKEPPPMLPLGARHAAKVGANPLAPALLQIDTIPLVSPRQHVHARVE